MENRASKHLTFWYEFASPYSYLAAETIGASAARFDVRIRWRAFLLGPIFKAQGWETSPFNLYPVKGRYMWRDMEREARELGLPPVQRPDPFPQNGLLAARIATIGENEHWGKAFARKVLAAQFASGRSISDPRILIDLLTGMDLNGVEIVDRAMNDANVKADLRKATEEAQELGIFGAPSFVTVDGELFWGNDRLTRALTW